ncbi:Smr/MutS family protein [Gammaproteobacteria bacterium]|nr:Smr/MutS family protein [Gammaproteobacteria bacterium]
MPTSRHEMDAFFDQMNHDHVKSTRHWYRCSASLSDKNRHAFESSDQPASLILDLHGKTSEAAYHASTDLLLFAQQHHCRIIKIIHGVGSQILQRELHQHLERSESMLLMTNKHHKKISRSCLWIWFKKSFDF